MLAYFAFVDIEGETDLLVLVFKTSVLNVFAYSHMSGRAYHHPCILVVCEAVMVSDVSVCNNRI